MTVKKCQTQVCGSHRLQKQKVFRLPPAAPGHLIFLRGCFANSSPRGASSSPFHLQLLTNMSALHFVKAFKAVHALCCSLLKHFHIFSHRTEVSSVLNCNGLLQCGLVSFLFPSQMFAYQSDVFPSSFAPSQPCWADLQRPGTTVQVSSRVRNAAHLESAQRTRATPHTAFP